MLLSIALLDKIFRYRHVRIYAPDKWMISWQFHHFLGYEMDWKNPKTFNEKLNWLKVYDRNPKYTQLADKVAVKDYVANKIGERYIIPTLAVFHSADDIDIENLPNQFVLKCNHDSGSIAICRDKKTFDIQTVKDELNGYLNRDFYSLFREWPYKNIRRCIFAEQFMEERKCEGESVALSDYKFFCFHGRPEFLYVDTQYEGNGHINYLTLDWQDLGIYREDYPPSSALPPKPQLLDEMIEISRKLSEGLRFVRVDLYEINGRIYFG